MREFNSTSVISDTSWILQQGNTSWTDTTNPPILDSCVTLLKLGSRRVDVEKSGDCALSRRRASRVSTKRQSSKAPRASKIGALTRRDFRNSHVSHAACRPPPRWEGDSDVTSLCAPSPLNPFAPTPAYSRSPARANHVATNTSLPRRVGVW